MADRTWPVLRRVMDLHTHVYRATGGRIGHHLPLLSPPFLLLDHVGAKSGIRRTSPVLYFEDGDDTVIVASKGGFPRNPAWFYNLKAHPETTVQVRSTVRRVRARVATPEERSRLWPKAEGAWRAFRAYQARSQGREIPLVILEPRP